MGNELERACCGQGSQINFRYEKSNIQRRIKNSRTIQDIRNQIANHGNIQRERVILAYNGQLLQDGDKLQSKSFDFARDHLNVFMTTSNFQENKKFFKVDIRSVSLNRKLKEVVVGSNSTIKQLKEEIKKKVKIHPQSRVIFNGLVIKDDEKLGKYGIEQKSVLQLYSPWVQY